MFDVIETELRELIKTDVIKDFDEEYFKYSEEEVKDEVEVRLEKMAKKIYEQFKEKK